MTLDLVKMLLEQLGNCNHLGGLNKKDEESESSVLADSFVASIQKVAKPGLNSQPPDTFLW